MSSGIWAAAALAALPKRGTQGAFQALESAASCAAQRAWEGPGTRQGEGVNAPRQARPLGASLDLSGSLW